MSDSEGDFSDELLELAGATEKKRRKRQASQGKSSSKKRKSGSVLYLLLALFFVEGVALQHPPNHSHFSVLTTILYSASVGSDSEDMQPESEENDVSSLNPYPLEDKYVDEADRQRCVFHSLVATSARPPAT